MRTRQDSSDVGSWGYLFPLPLMKSSKPNGYRGNGRLSIWETTSKIPLGSSEGGSSSLWGGLARDRLVRKLCFLLSLINH
ncbi:hypothetical protein CDAR_236431 [Caerostris darwini]|uniref:Uncharacterized protein n=1 Tax=Caerostris darwini TaxID=1538125 RepID=A0AAV4TAK4_9ARAC|nr:hypothetical protein CDAR_236431 [Caerostris darwini]